MPVPTSFGPGVNNVLWTLGDAISGIWEYSSATDSFVPYPSQPQTDLESRCPYVFVSGSNILIADSAYGLLSLVLGNPVLTGTPLSGGPWMSCVTIGSGDLFAINSSGQDSSGLFNLGNPFWGAEPQGQGSLFYGYMGPSGFGQINFSSMTSGITGCPSGMMEINCLVPLSGSVMMGGWGVASLARDATSFLIGPNSVALSVAPGLSGGTIGSWGQTITPGFWTFVTYLTGVGLGSSLAGSFFSPVSALIVDATSGVFSSYSYLGGTITQIQTISLSGIAPYVGVMNLDTTLVPQTSTSSVLQLVLSGNTWVLSGTALTGVPDPTTIQIQGNFAAVGFGSGVVILDNSSGWSVVSCGALGFVPTASTQDSNGNYFFAGQNQTALVSSTGGLLGTGIYSGAGGAVGAAFYQSQYFVSTTDTINSIDYQALSSGLALISIIGASGLAHQQLWDGTLWNSVTGTPTLSGAIWDSSGTILIPSSLGVLEMEITSPFRLGYRRASSSVVYSGAYQALSGLGLGNSPCQIVQDSSGVVRIITTEGNQLIMSGNSVSSSSQIFSGGGSLVGVVSGQGGLWGAIATVPCVVNF